MLWQAWVRLRQWNTLSKGQNHIKDFQRLPNSRQRRQETLEGAELDPEFVENCNSKLKDIKKHFGD